MPRKRFLDTLKFGKLYDMEFPDKNTCNPALYELYVTSNLWVAFLNNAASEQSARMNAMENASKNAGEILDKLTLQYNKARQARITMELVEIISGASALWALSQPQLKQTTKERKSECRHMGRTLPSSATLLQPSSFI